MNLWHDWLMLHLRHGWLMLHLRVWRLVSRHLLRNEQRNISRRLLVSCSLPGNLHNVRNGN